MGTQVDVLRTRPHPQAEEVHDLRCEHEPKVVRPSWRRARQRAQDQDGSEVERGRVSARALWMAQLRSASGSRPFTHFKAVYRFLLRRHLKHDCHVLGSHTSGTHTHITLELRFVRRFRT